MNMVEMFNKADSGQEVLESDAKTGQPVYSLIAYRMVNGSGVEELP